MQKSTRFGRELSVLCCREVWLAPGANARRCCFGLPMAPVDEDCGSVTLFFTVSTAVFGRFSRVPTGRLADRGYPNRGGQRLRRQRRLPPVGPKGITFQPSPYLSAILWPNRLCTFLHRISPWSHNRTLIPGADPRFRDHCRYFFVVVVHRAVSTFKTTLHTPSMMSSIQKFPDVHQAVSMRLVQVPANAYT